MSFITKGDVWQDGLTIAAHLFVTWDVNNGLLCVNLKARLKSSSLFSILHIKNRKYISCLVWRSQIIKPFTKSNICFSFVNSFSFELTVSWVVAYFKVQLDIFIAELMQGHDRSFGTQEFAKSAIRTSTSQFGTDCKKKKTV